MVYKKNLLNRIEIWKINDVCQFVKNLLNLIKKWERKPEELIDKKPSKLNEKIKKKTDYLLFYKRWKTFKT